MDAVPHNRKRKRIERKVVEIDLKIMPDGARAPFSKGETGNPWGVQGKRVRLTAGMRQFIQWPAARLPVFAELAEALELDPECYTVGDVIMLQFLHSSLSDKPAFVKELFERTEGKVTQPVEMRNDYFTEFSDEELLAIIQGEGDGLLSPDGNRYTPKEGSG